MYRLTPDLYSRTQLQHVQRQLHKVRSTTTKGSNRVSDLDNFLDGNKLDKLDANNLVTIKQFIDSTLKTAPQISIVLATLPTSSERDELVNWFRSNIQPNLLMHFIQNDDILAGCVVRTDSAVYDWSLQQALRTNVDRLAQELRHV